MSSQQIYLLRSRFIDKFHRSSQQLPLSAACIVARCLVRGAKPQPRSNRLRLTFCKAQIHSIPFVINWSFRFICKLVAWAGAKSDDPLRCIAMVSSRHLCSKTSTRSLKWTRSTEISGVRYHIDHPSTWIKFTSLLERMKLLLCYGSLWGITSAVRPVIYHWCRSWVYVPNLSDLTSVQ